MTASPARQCAPAVAGATGRALRGLALAILSGLLLYFASPGAGGWAGLAWFGLAPLMFALRRATPRTATLLGLTCGLAFYLPLLAWIITVLATYGQVQPAVAATALLLLALYMAGYLALFARWFSMAPGHHLLWFAPALWVGLDVLRGWLFTGFPWQDLGYSQYTLLPLIQVADLLGHHGVTCCLVLCNTIIALLLTRRTAESRDQPRLTNLIAAALLLLLAMGYGLLRLPLVSAAMQQSPTLPVALVQGNIPQDQKWAPAYQEATVREYVALSEEALGRQPRSLVVWPETALPFYPLENSLFLRLTDLTRPRGAALLTGAPHREPDPTAGGELRYYNSSFLIGPDGRVAGQYHKQHLVPFGEYIPLRTLLPFFAPIVETLGDFSPGDSRAPLALGPARLGVLICFESIFPELARQSSASGANLLVNLTNDAWFGRSTAPWQHLSMAVLRAVENRRSLARAANTGISAVIMPTGKVSGPTGLFTTASRTAQVPLLSTATFFNQAGHLFGLCSFGLALCGIVITIRTDKKSRSTKP